jgi:hemerythrin-like domain-containing protein
VARLLAEHASLRANLTRLDALIGPRYLDPKDPTDRVVLEEIRDSAARLVHPTGHEAREEKVLIPALQREGHSSLVEEIRNSHERLREKARVLRLDSIDLLADKNGQWLEVRSKARELVASLRDHIETEEREVYPTALREIREKAVWDELKRAGEDPVLL